MALFLKSETGLMYHLQPFWIEWYHSIILDRMMHEQ